MHATARAALFAIFAGALISTATALNATPISASKLKVDRGKVFFYVGAKFTKARFKKIRGFGKRVGGSVDMTSKQIKIDIDTRDFSTRNRGRDKDMHEDVLESSRHKIATFRGRILNYDSATGNVKASGVIKVRGKEQKLTLEGRVKKTKTGWRLRVVFPLSLKAHGIKAPSNLFVLRVGDTVRVKVFLYLVPAG